MQGAVEIQRRLSERNATLEPERRMWFRIGINLGDVIVERDDIYGDDVNIAARLQSMAEPGGVLISGTVFDQVKNKLSLGFESLGPQRLKNIDAEVPVYRAVMQGGPATPAAATPDRAPTAPEGKRHALIMSAVRVGAIGAVGIIRRVGLGSRNRRGLEPSRQDVFVRQGMGRHLSIS